MNASNRLLVIAALFVTCLITANTVAVKWIAVGPFSLPAAVLIFPFSYIFGDILTEVYGYRWARRVIWLGFACNFIFVAFVYLGQIMPAASFWNLQPAYQSILGYTPRLLLGSFCGYLVGEFANSAVMARMKILTRGRFLWTRTIGSTIVGEGLDTAVFQVVAFAGTGFFTPVFILYHWGAKTLIETLATPATYAVVGSLKRRENQDTYDYSTNFNPFAI